MHVPGCLAAADAAALVADVVVAAWTYWDETACTVHHDAAAAVDADAWHRTWEACLPWEACDFPKD
jgi:hypothetical protein